MESFFFKTVECRKLTWKFKGILLFVFILLALFLYRPVLTGFGSFLAVEQSRKNVDVLLVEGINIIHQKAYKTALQLYKAGVGKEIIFVLQRTGGTYYGVNNFTDAYVDILRQDLTSKGIPNDIIVVLEQHPVTLNAGKGVAHYISKNRKSVKSVTLISHAFHTRRSFLSYRKAFQKIDVKINAFGYFTEFDHADWWLSAKGFRAFVGEFLKYGYYVSRGWI